MRRRDFIKSISGAAVAWPLTARAQQAAMPVIGLLGSGSLSAYASRVAALRRGLGEFGYVEGRSVIVEYRWAEGQPDQLPKLATDLVQRRVAAIVTIGGALPALAAKAATSTIPIVFAAGADPVKSGLVASLNRPGGNLTGATSLSVQLGAKGVGLLYELVPTLATIALLMNPSNPAHGPLLKDVQEAVHTLGLQLHVQNATVEQDLDTSFTTLVQSQARALLVGNDSSFTIRREQLAALAARHAVPAIYPLREFPAAGGLMSYGPPLSEIYRQVGIYAGRILKGEKPADLPVQQTTKLELVINLRAAKALGLEIPPKVLALADEVIE
jgi:putative ABC transport system substrate-binding protein